jgi:phosphoserine phosphatase
VEHPVAVDPDPILADHAARAGWPQISLMDTPHPVGHRHP